MPQSGRRIKIIADEYVDREFGTGALKITPGGCLQRCKGWLACGARKLVAGPQLGWVRPRVPGLEWWYAIREEVTVCVHARAPDPAPLTPLPPSLSLPSLLTAPCPLPQATM